MSRPPHIPIPLLPIKHRKDSSYYDGKEIDDEIIFSMHYDLIPRIRSVMITFMTTKSSAGPDSRIVRCPLAVRRYTGLGGQAELTMYGRVLVPFDRLTRVGYADLTFNDGMGVLVTKLFTVDLGRNDDARSGREFEYRKGVHIRYNDKTSDPYFCIFLRHKGDVDNREM